MKKTIKAWQQKPRISRVSARLVAPVFKGAQRICAAVPWMVKVNGGRVQCDGVDLVFPPDTGIMYSTLLYWRGSAGYEAPTWRVLKELIPAAGSFLDIGSNIGLYAVLAAKIRPDLPVDAFEPVPSLAEGNRRFHEANGLSPHSVREVALSDSEGRARLQVPKYAHVREAEPTATLRADVHLSPGAVEEDMEVATECLDHFLRDNERPDHLLVKIDVEGHEATVLKGATETLGERRPVVIVELLPNVCRDEEIEALLRPLDYDLWAICREGLFRFVFEDLPRARTFTDFVLVPRENVATTVHYIPHVGLAELLP